MRETWETAVNAFQFSGTETGPAALKESTTLTTISPGSETAGKVFQIPASFFVVGQLLRITAGGIISTKATESAWTFGPYWLIEAQTAATGKALTEANVVKLSAVNRKSVGWQWESFSRVTVAGEKGKLITNGKFVINGINEVAGSVYGIPSKESTTGGESPELNFSKEGKLVFAAKPGESSAENAIQQFTWLIEILN